MNKNSLRYRFLKYLLYSFSRVLSDKKFLQLKFRLFMGYPLDLDHPKTFNEKLQWLKLYDRNPKYSRMVDKAEAKSYVANIIGEEHIIPTLGVYDNPEDIDFDSLPDQFVLKTTHDSGGVFICRDKKNFDKNEVIKKLNRRLKRNVFWLNREWPYKNVMPRVLAEKFLNNEQVELCLGSTTSDNKQQGLTDYKFYCFDGIPQFLYISKGLEDHKTASISFLTMDWEFAPFKRSDYNSFNYLPAKPSKFDDMLTIAKRLAKGHPFIRVDLYQSDNQIYFSELTLTPCSGMMPFEPKLWDRIVGDYLNLSL